MIRSRIASLRTFVATFATAAIVIALATPAPVAAALPLTLVQGGFSEPVFVTHAFDSRLFVVEKGGLVKIVGGGTFLNVSAKIATGGERGLLALAFHPNYASNGLFYIDYTRVSDGDLVIAEYRRMPGNPSLADPSYERILLTIDHSAASNHNGGTLLFKSGLLYITVGDGGGDPGTRAQSLSSMLGKILRINPLDPDGAGTQRYSVPTGNPYVGKTGLDEIWSRGLRNPWRCSFDRGTGKLYCPDVGQGSWEEVNRHRSGKGVNFGWQLLEGFHYYRYPGRPPGDRCTSGCKTLPIAAYPHFVPGGESNCSVTGGYVSRRQGAPLFGKYLFADYCSGRVWAINADFARGAALPAPMGDLTFNVSSFGEDFAGRLYVVDLGGRVFRLNES